MDVKTRQWQRQGQAESSSQEPGTRTRARMGFRPTLERPNCVGSHNAIAGVDGWTSREIALDYFELFSKTKGFIRKIHYFFYLTNIFY